MRGSEKQSAGATMVYMAPATLFTNSCEASGFFTVQCQ